MKSANFRNSVALTRLPRGIPFTPGITLGKIAKERGPRFNFSRCRAARKEKQGIREIMKPVLAEAKKYPLEKRNHRALIVLFAIGGGVGAFFSTIGAAIYDWNFLVPVLAFIIPPGLAWIINSRTIKTKTFRKIPKDIRLAILNLAENYSTLYELKQYSDRANMLKLLGDKSHPGQILTRYGLLFLDLLDQHGDETGSAIRAIYEEHQAYVNLIVRSRKVQRGVAEYIKIVEEGETPSPLPTLEEITKVNQELERLINEKPQTKAVGKLLSLKDHHDKPLTRALPQNAAEFFPGVGDEKNPHNLSKIHHLVIYEVIVDILEILEVLEPYSKANEALKDPEFLATFDHPQQIQNIKNALELSLSNSLELARAAFKEHINEVRPPKPGSPIPNKFMDVDGPSHKALEALRDDMRAKLAEGALKEAKLAQLVPRILTQYQAFQNSSK